MSRWKTVSVTCLQCGHTQQTTVWTSLNVGVDPEMKQELPDRRINVFHCQNCDTQATICLSHPRDSNPEPDAYEASALPIELEWLGRRLYSIFPRWASSHLARLWSSAAAMKAQKRGGGRFGRDLNSGWNWVLTIQG
jgi:hypothetical protein